MAGQAQVLRELGSGWQECFDSQGVFYFNSLTGQSQDSPPQGVAGAPLVHQHQPVVAQAQPGQYAAAYCPANAYQVQGVQPQPMQEATVKMKLGIWSVCEDQQGEFYHNGTTGQTFDNPPPELVELFKRSQGGAPSVAPAAPTYQASVPGGMAQVQQVAQQPATVKAKVGVWSVCEDQQGEFYHNGATGQTFDSPPPELVGLLQRSQGVSHAAPVHQAQAAPVYQSPAAQGYPTTAGAQAAPVYHTPASATGTFHYPGASSVQSNGFKSPGISNTTPVYHSSGAQHAVPNAMSSPQYFSQGPGQVGYQF